MLFATSNPSSLVVVILISHFLVTRIVGLLVGGGFFVSIATGFLRSGESLAKDTGSQFAVNYAPLSYHHLFFVHYLKKKKKSSSSHNNNK